MAVSNAYYPGKIRDWPTHRNLLDDVDASHVNNLQSELAAVMLTMGESPHIYNDIQTDREIPKLTPTDDGGLADNETSFLSATRNYNPAVKPVNHGSVAARLDSIERGKNTHAFRLRASSIDISSSGVAFSDRPRGVRFPAASAANDPFSYHNGVGVTLRKSGFWLFTGNIVYALTGTTSAANNGIYLATIEIDTNYMDAMVRDEETGGNKTPSMNPLLMGFFERGTRVSLRTAHNSGRVQKVRNAYFSGACLRES